MSVWTRGSHAEGVLLSDLAADKRGVRSAAVSCDATLGAGVDCRLDMLYRGRIPIADRITSCACENAITLYGLAPME